MQMLETDKTSAFNCDMKLLKINLVKYWSFGSCYPRITGGRGLQNKWGHVKYKINVWIRTLLYLNVLHATTQPSKSIKYATLYASSELINLSNNS